MKVPDEQLYDTRLQKRYLRDGLLTPEQLATHLSKLEDIESLGDYIDPYSEGEVEAGADQEQLEAPANEEVAQFEE